MIRRVAASLAVLAATAMTQPLTTEERESAIAELQASRKALLNAVTGLTPEQWTFKPGPDRWSIVECVEHIALTEDSYFRLITERLVKAPAEPGQEAAPEATDAEVLRKMPDRSSKRQTSAALEPKGKTPREALSHFERGRERFLAYVRTTSDDLRHHFRAHRAVGRIDAYQWILLAAGHTLRHTDQILEVKRDPRFPAAK